MIWVYQLTSSNAAVSLYMIMFFLASVTFSLIAGVASDTFDRKKIMVLANLVWGLIVLAFIPAKESFPLILAVTLATQAMDEFFNPSQGASLPQLVENKKLLTANSWFYIATYAASFVGYFLSGVLLRFFSYEYPFIIASVLVLLGAAFSLSLPPLRTRKRSVGFTEFTRTVVKRLLEQWNFLLRNRNIVSTVVVMAAVVSGAASAGALAPGFSEQVLKIDARDLSFIGVLPLGLGLLTGAFILSRFGKLWEVWESVLVFGVVLLLLAISPTLRVLFANHLTTPQAFEIIPFYSLSVAALVLLLGVAASTVAIPIFTSIQRITPKGNLGRTFGSMGMLAAIFTSLLTLTTGTLADFFSPALPVVAIGIFAVVVSFWIRYRVVIK